MRSRVTGIVVTFATLIITISSFAEDAPPKRISQQVIYNNKQEFAGLTVRIGALSLIVQSDQRNGYLKAGDMPTLRKGQDIEGRDVSIGTDGTPLAQINVKQNGHPDKVIFSNGVTYSITPQGQGLYKESLSDAIGKPVHVRSVSPDPRRPAELVNLDVVADVLGLSADWRNEIAIDVQDSLVTISDKAGKLLLYVVRNGPDSVGFTPEGTPLYYDVMAFLYVGRAETGKEYADLDTLVPDHFVYTRDGRVGAYIRTPAVGGIHSFWTGRDVTGKTLVHFSAGANAAGSPHTGASLSISPAEASHGVGDRQLAESRRSLRPGSNVTYYCETTQTCYTYEWGESGCFPAQTTCYCVDCTAGGGGTCGGLPSILSALEPQPECGGGGTSPGSGGANQVTGDAQLHAAVDSGVSNASSKLGNQQCAALLSSLTTTSPQMGGTSLQSIMNQRGWNDARSYLSSGIGFYTGQNHTDSSGQAPCGLSYRYAWTEPFKTQVWICDKFKELAGTPGWAGVYTLHELLHTLGLPEGGSGQYTHQQITDIVANSCGTN